VDTSTSVHDRPAAAIGSGSADRFLTDHEVRDIVPPRPGDVAARRARLLIIIPDGTRTMPMPLMFEAIEERRLACRRARLPGGARHAPAMRCASSRA